MNENKIELLEEELECVHMFLDQNLISRRDARGEDYSIIGRIRILMGMIRMDQNYS